MDIMAFVNRYNLFNLLGSWFTITRFGRKCKRSTVVCVITTVLELSIHVRDLYLSKSVPNMECLSVIALNLNCGFEISDMRDIYLYCRNETLKVWFLFDWDTWTFISDVERYY